MKKDYCLIMTALLVILELIFVFAGQAAAHKPSDSYLTLIIDNERIEGRWDIALKDLDHAIGLDLDQNGELTWGEVKQKHGDIEAYALARLVLEIRDGTCRLSGLPQLIENHSDGPHTVLPFKAICPGPIEGLSVGYRLFFDLDPSHRGQIQIRSGGETVSSILAPGNDTYRWKSGVNKTFQTVLTYVGEGVWHILIGFDHILFLVCLLLPAGLRRVDGQWSRVARWRDVVWPVIHTVTAFTVAHSITLGAAVLGLVSLPSWLVEPVIAGSIIIAALNNIWPVVIKRLWLVAFCFGLIHGFGFAGVLSDLGLPKHALSVSLLGFNLGVELGQLSIVAVVLPLILILALQKFYCRYLMPAGSALTAFVATVWLWERSSDIQIF